MISNKKMEKVVVKILKHFDFDAVLSYMTAAKWRWAETETANKIMYKLPDRRRLLQVAGQLMEDLINENLKFVSLGGGISRRKDTSSWIIF